MDHYGALHAGRGMDMLTTVFNFLPVKPFCSHITTAVSVAAADGTSASSWHVKLCISVDNYIHCFRATKAAESNFYGKS